MIFIILWFIVLVNTVYITCTEDIIKLNACINKKIFYVFFYVYYVCLSDKVYHLSHLLKIRDLFLRIIGTEKSLYNTNDPVNDCSLII